MAISDEKRKRIIADRIGGDSIRTIAKKYGVSVTTVAKISKSDTELAQKITQKQLENTEDTLLYMRKQREKKKRILDKLLSAIEAKTENIDMFTNIRDLATAYGIIIDKEIKLAELNFLNEDQERSTEIDPLSRSLLDLAGGLDGD